MKNDKDLENYLKIIYNSSINVVESAQVLLASQIPKGMKVQVVDTSVLFVDIRHSSILSDSVGTKNMTKIYKMYATLASMSVRENDGQIYQFAGDGFMAAFGSKKNNSRLNSYNSVLRIKELIDNVYKDITEDSWHFDCGYSVCTGHVFMTRLKAKPFKLNSFGIFPSGVTNLSSKLCNLADENELIIDSNTYDHIKNKATFERITTVYGDVYKCKLNK
ncbi:MAG: hypothetical protein NUK62_07985 [Tenericutes bacterium]|nr:hypothetical protein [Mycoplasmatota bacterium]